MARAWSETLGVPPCQARTSRICTKPAGAGHRAQTHPLRLLRQRRDGSAGVLRSGDLARRTVERCGVDGEKVHTRVRARKIAGRQVAALVVERTEGRQGVTDHAEPVSVEDPHGALDLGRISIPAIPLCAVGWARSSATSVVLIGTQSTPALISKSGPTSLKDDRHSDRCSYAVDSRIDPPDGIFRSLVDASPDVIGTIDRDGRFLYLNAAGGACSNTPDDENARGTSIAPQTTTDRGPISRRPLGDSSRRGPHRG